MLRLPTNEEDEWERAAAAIALAAARPPPPTNTADAITSTAAAFGALRIMPPPPPTDNGGAFEPRGDGEGVSAATASAVAAQLDPVLVSCLENPRERLSMLQFEDQIVRFVKNPREAQLSFPPLSSYHRLIIHRLAQRCFLEHQTGDYNPYAVYDGNSSRVVTLFKTSQTSVPPVLLIDLSTDRQQPAVTPASAPRIMARKRGAQRPGANGGRGSGAGKDGGKAARSMQDRERAYAEARARIFGEDSAADSAPSTASTSSATTPESGGNGSNGQSRGNNRQAAGPDGSKGFNRSRGASPSTTQEEKASAGQASQRQQRPARSPVTDPQSWKESKALWRNREQEMNDPDFTRNHGAYQPIRTATTGNSDTGRYVQAQPARYGGGAPAYVRQGGEFDRSLPGNYSPQQQQQRQQQFAGGRGRYPSEFSSRVDGLAPPPPPQQQFYRGGPQQMTPPPPVAFMGRGHSAFSPQTRSQASMSVGGGRGNGNGGYNQDFPPLGR